jgi:two-component system KDP operon response regulator KdpE
VSALSPTILVIEDEPQMRRFVRASLTTRGYQLLEGSTVKEAKLLTSSHRPDLMLLDLGLPDGDGIELTKELREWTKMPIIVLSARGLETDKVAALDAGADDYLIKPFGVDELLARIRVALRHAEGEAKPDAAQPILEFGTLRIDLVRREVTQAGAAVRLTPTEYKMLVLLARNAGKVLTHNHILNEVWGRHNGNMAHHVRVHMALLRKKIEVDATRPRLIVTEPGVGYRLRDLTPHAAMEALVGKKGAGLALPSGPWSRPPRAPAASRCRSRA